MMPKMRTATPATIVDVETACHHLRAARACLAQANAPRASEKVRHALKSAEGALRHAHHRLARSQDSVSSRQPTAMST